MAPAPPSLTLMETRVVGRAEAGQKLLKYLRKVLPEAPDSFFYKMLRKKNIDLAGHGKCTGTEVLVEGDLVRFFLSEETFVNFGGRLRSEKMSKDENHAHLESFGVTVIYEDEDFFFVSKPAGLLTQGDRSGEKSLAELLKEASPPDSLIVWSPMHRLDRNTSGLVLCGKTVRGQQFLAKVLRERALTKEYLALAKGHLPGEGSFLAFHSKDPRTNTARITKQRHPGSEPIETVFYEIARSGDYSLIRAELVTGRSHQIRAHLAFLGCPIVGDIKYGGQETVLPGIRTQLLHAKRVTFDSNADLLAGRTFAAPIPTSMKGVLHTYGFQK